MLGRREHELVVGRAQVVDGRALVVADLGRQKGLGERIVRRVVRLLEALAPQLLAHVVGQAEQLIRARDDGSGVYLGVLEHLSLAREVHEQLVRGTDGALSSARVPGGLHLSCDAHRTSGPLAW